MQVFIIAISIIVFIWIVFHVTMYFIQDKTIFNPEKLPTNYKFSFSSNFEEINLETQDGNIQNGLLFKVKKTKGLVLFFHNHSGNIEHWSRSALFMNNLGHDVLMMDYRGYGKSTGKFNEQGFLKDSELWYNYALKKYDESLITVYGRGIGATFATCVTSLNNPKQLLLEAPMYNLAYLGRYHYPFMVFEIGLKYVFNTAEYFIKVKCKTYIFHGKKDKLIHFKNSLKLYNLAKENKELYIIEEGNHYNLINNKLYLNKINEIL